MMDDVKSDFGDLKVISMGVLKVTARRGLIGVAVGLGSIFGLFLAPQFMSEPVAKLMTYISLIGSSEPRSSLETSVLIFIGTCYIFAFLYAGVMEIGRQLCLLTPPVDGGFQDLWSEIVKPTRYKSRTLGLSVVGVLVAVMILAVWGVYMFVNGRSFYLGQLALIVTLLFSYISLHGALMIKYRPLRRKVNSD